MTMYAQSVGSDNYWLFGINKEFIFGNHEYYRIVTAPFAHGDILHLVVNMIALSSLSVPVIRFTDEKFSFIIYFVAALVSSLGVLFFSDALTVGSSGAIYGLFGVLIYFAFKQRKYGYDDMFKSLMPVIFVNLIISIMPGVSLVGHLFGLLAGLVGSYIYDKNRRRQYW